MNNMTKTDPTPAEIMEQVLIAGDLSALTEEERARYYMAVCKSVCLNPLTRPFEYIVLDGKLTLYARKDCAEQLRALHKVAITNIERADEDDLAVVIATAKHGDGRVDTDVGAVALVHPAMIKNKLGRLERNPQAGEPLAALDRANAKMKAVTKAKRRVTLSLCGLGFLDETEVEDILSAGAAVEASEKQGRVSPLSPPVETTCTFDDVPVADDATGAEAATARTSAPASPSLGAHLAAAGEAHLDRAYEQAKAYSMPVRTGTVPGAPSGTATLPVSGDGYLAPRTGLDKTVSRDLDASAGEASVKAALAPMAENVKQHAAARADAAREKQAKRGLRMVAEVKGLLERNGKSVERCIGIVNGYRGVMEALLPEHVAEIMAARDERIADLEANVETKRNVA